MVFGPTPSTISVASGPVVLSLVDTAVTISPSCRLPGLATLHFPSAPIVVDAVLLSGNVTVTTAPANPVPVISGRFGPIGSMSVIGNTPSTISVASGPWLLTLSVPIALTSSPSCRPGFGTSHVPSAFTVVVTVSPFGKVTVIVDSGSPVPLTGVFGPIGLISVIGPTPSTISFAGAEVLPAASLAMAVISSPSFKLPGFGTLHLP